MHKTLLALLMLLPLTITFMPIGGGGPAPYPLGTWFGFPGCYNQGPPCCSATFPPFGAADYCELMGNSSYRGILQGTGSSGSAGLSVSLLVGCVAPATGADAALTLQYANYSSTTHANSTNFVNTSGVVRIDNSAGFTCPGTLESTSFFTLPSQTGNPAVYEFRVVATDGNGPGDNPRFSNIAVIATQIVTRIAQVTLTSITKNGFTAFLSLAQRVASSQAEPFQWIATNITSTSCVTLSVCIQHGSSTCTIAVGLSQCSVAVTFGTAFSAIPNVVATPTALPGVVGVPAGAVTLFSAETVSV
jgi:hypothetical protein